MAIVADGIYVEDIKLLTKSAGSWEIMLQKWGEINKQGTLLQNHIQLRLQETSKGSDAGILAGGHHWGTQQWTLGTSTSD